MKDLLLNRLIWTRKDIKTKSLKWKKKLNSEKLKRRF